jgi:hypothetical protein
MEATIESTDLLHDLGADGSVREHCRIQALLPALAAAVRLARDCFRPEPRILLSLSVDPEGGPARLIIDVQVRCSVDAAVAAYDSFLPRWIASATRPDREKVILVYAVA